MKPITESFTSMEMEVDKKLEGSEHYLQPLRYRVSKSFLQTAEVVAVYMPVAWKEMMRGVYFDSKKKKPLKALINSILTEFPEVYTSYLVDASYLGNVPFLFIDKDEYEQRPSLLTELSLSFVSNLKEYNRIYDWGIKLSVINSFVLEPLEEAITLYEMLEKPYKYGVFSGYFTSRLCRAPLTVQLEVYRFNEERVKVDSIIEEELSFSHAMEKNKHSAVSRPMEIAGGYCSFVLSLSLYESLVDDEDVYIQLKTSVRQWICSSEPTNYKSYIKGASLYIGSFKQWESSKLMTTSFKAKKTGSQEELVYEISHAHRQHLERYGTSLRKVLDETMLYLQNGEREDELFVGIPAANATLSWWEQHKKFRLTGNGVTLEEERNFYLKIAESVDGLEVVEGFPNVQTKSGELLGKGKSKKVYFSRMLLPTLLRGREVRLNIFVPHEQYFRYLKEELLDLLEDKAGKEVVFPLKEVDLCLVSFLNGQLNIRLNPVVLSSAFKIYNGSEEEKLAEIIKEISPHLSSEQVEMNLFFIPDYHKSKNPQYKKKDPIQLVRQAFLQLHKHVQFINYSADEAYPSRESSKKSLNHAYRNAMLDSLSKLGIEQGIRNYNVPTKSGLQIASEIVEFGVVEGIVNKKKTLFFTKYEGGQVYIKGVAIGEWQ